MLRAFSALTVAFALAGALPAWAQDYPSPSPQPQERAQEPAAEVKKAKKPRSSRNLITREQIDKAVEKGATSAYDIVQSIRRDWFRVRGDLTVGGGAGGGAYGSSTNRPYIYLDNQSMGEDPELLRQVKPEMIKEIRYLSGADATTLFGTGFTHGVIQVITQ